MFPHLLTKMSSLGIPLSRTAWPTSTSFPYTLAESMCLPRVGPPVNVPPALRPRVCLPVPVLQRHRARGDALIDVLPYSEPDQRHLIACARHNEGQDCQWCDGCWLCSPEDSRMVDASVRARVVIAVAVCGGANVLSRNHCARSALCRRPSLYQWYPLSPQRRRACTF